MVWKLLGNNFCLPEIPPFSITLMDGIWFAFIFTFPEENMFIIGGSLHTCIFLRHTSKKQLQETSRDVKTKCFCVFWVRFCLRKPHVARLSNLLTVQTRSPTSCLFMTFVYETQQFANAEMFNILCFLFWSASLMH